MRKTLPVFRTSLGWIEFGRNWVLPVTRAGAGHGRAASASVEGYGGGGGQMVEAAGEETACGGGGEGGEGGGRRGLGTDREQGKCWAEGTGTVISAVGNL